MITLLLVAEATRLDDLGGVETLFVLALAAIIVVCIVVCNAPNQNHQSSSHTFHRVEPPRLAQPSHSVHQRTPQCDVTIDVVKAVIIRAPKEETEQTSLDNPQTYRRLQ